MRDLERLLRESLKSVGDAFAPSDPVAARQRYLKRRRRRLFRVSFGTAVATATAIALLLYVSPASGPDVRGPALDVTSRFLAVTQSIPVGDAPSGIDIGGAGVWVANSGDGSVMRIDQTSNEIAETVDVGGAPDDVAVGDDAVWVADPSLGVVTKIQFPAGTEGVVQTSIEVARPGQHLDIAFGEGGVWVVAAGEGVLKRIDPETDQVEQWAAARRASDVAVGDGEVWTLGERHAAGRSFPVIARTNERDDTSELPLAEEPQLAGSVQRNADLAVGGGGVWLSVGETGALARIDPTGKATDVHFLEGAYTGVSVYRGLVWGVTGALDHGVEGAGLLTRFDDGTGDRVGEALPLTGRPFDVAVGRTGIWLTHNSTNSVSHIGDTESPAPAPTEDGQAEARAEDVVFVYSAGGDVFGETLEGERVVLAAGPEDEVWPSLAPDGTELLYQLGSGPPGEIFHVDLETSTTTSLGAGQYPSFAPDGRAAWVVDNGTDEPHIVVGVPSSEPDAEIVPIAEWDGPIQVNPPIAWDPVGDYIYYAAGWEETSELYQTDSRGDPDPFPMIQEMALERGTHLRGPHVRDESSVHVFSACCMKGIEDPWETFELGRVSFTEGGGDYETVLELDPRQFPQTFVGWYPQVISAGHLWRDEDTGVWDSSEQRSWIIVNQIDAWLLSEGGESQHLSDVLIDEYDYPTQHDGGIPGTFEGWGTGSAIESD
ncbi:MAG: hypothetical protein ACRDJJ_00850 [Actinomycetota bacterium]